MKEVEMIKMTEVFGFASQEVLKDFERKHAFSLPDEYKLFLTHQNGGVPNLGKFIVPGWGESLVILFYGIGIGGTNDIESTIKSFRDLLDLDVVPIGDDPGGNQICLGLRNERLGKVYFWDHNDWDDEGNPGEPIEIASSLGNFFALCKSD